MTKIMPKFKVWHLLYTFVLLFPLVMTGCTTLPNNANPAQNAIVSPLPVPPTLPVPAEAIEREAVDFDPGSNIVERSGLLPSGPGVNQYVLNVEVGQTITVDVTSDGSPLSLTIERPSGNQWIPEMRKIGVGSAIGHDFVAPEDGEYVITMVKPDHTPSTNYVLTITREEAASSSGTPSEATAAADDAGTVEANGIMIAYESFGTVGNETILLIPGTGMQLVDWPLELIYALVEQGYRVVRFDNRDVGLSTKMTEAGLPDEEAITAALQAGEPAPLPYRLQDMAADTIGLMDALDIDQAHLVGASMGGAIAQLVAIDYPARVGSLTLFAADSGNPELPLVADEEAMAAAPLLTAGMDREAFIEWQVKTWQVLEGDIYMTDEATLRERAERNLARNFDVDGIIRQQTMMLIDWLEPIKYRMEHLADITAPTVVLQGTGDPLQPVASAEDLVERIPNAELRLVEGLGHTVPVALVPEFVDAIMGAATRAE